MILSTSYLSGIRITTETFVFPVLRCALCSLRSAVPDRYALCNSGPRGDIGKYARMLQLGENHELDSFRS